MSEREDEATRAEEEAIAVLLDGGEPASAPREGEAALYLRLNRETLGLLAYGTTAPRPSPTLKARLLESALAAEAERAKAAPLAAPAAQAARVSPVGPVPLQRRLAMLEPLRLQRSSWPFRIAATFALVAFGLAGGLAWQLERRSSDERQMRALLAQLGARAQSAEARAADAGRLRETLALLTSRAVSACVLQPSEAGDGARGVMYVASDHQHWYLRLEGLAPAPEGKEYRVWFMANGIPRSAGRAPAGPDQSAEMASDTMPAGTTAVLVSLEPAGSALPEPTGARVLFGDRMVEIS